MLMHSSEKPSISVLTAISFVSSNDYSAFLFAPQTTYRLSYLVKVVVDFTQPEGNPRAKKSSSPHVFQAEEKHSMDVFIYSQHSPEKGTQRSKIRQ